MGKKKFLERISDALGLYDPDDPNRVMEEEEEDEEAEEEEVVEKPVRKGFPKAVRPAPVPVRRRLRQQSARTESVRNASSRARRSCSSGSARPDIIRRAGRTDI